MSDTDPSDKTEEATPERRKKAREEGQFPRAKDAGAVAATLGILLYVAATWPSIAAQLHEFSIYCFSHPDSLIGGDLTYVGQRLGGTLLFLSMPTVVIACIAALGMGFLEAGFQIHLKILEPKWERLEPIGKLQQLFNPKEALLNTALSLGRVGVIAAVAYTVLRAELPTLQSLARAPLAAGVQHVAGVALRLGFWASLALALLSALDFVKSFFKHEEGIRMSRQEVKDEHHQQEGDPRVKQRMRAKAREIVKRGLLKEVKTSDVVVTNPTHIAVAIRYRPEQGAPIVAAKGYDDVAQYIKKIARENGITVIENKPLARALAEKVKPGRVIPVELYTAVAEVLAFVYRLQGRGIKA